MQVNPKVSWGRRRWNSPVQGKGPIPSAVCPPPEKQKFPEYLLRSGAIPRTGAPQEGTGTLPALGLDVLSRFFRLRREVCLAITSPTPSAGCCICAACWKQLKELLIALLGENEPVNTAICCEEHSRPEHFLAAMIIFSCENELALPLQSYLHRREVSEEQQSDYLGVRPCPSLEEMRV